MQTARVVGMGIGLGSNSLHLEHVDDGKEADEKEEKKNKETNRPDEQGDIDPGGGEVAPRGGKKVAVDGGDDDDKALKPHARVGEHHDGQNDPWVLATVFEPEKLRGGYVAGDHRPVRPPVGSKGTVRKGVDFKGVAAVPRDKELHRVGVTDQGSGEQNDLAHVVDVLVGDQIVQSV